MPVRLAGQRDNLLTRTCQRRIIGHVRQPRRLPGTEIMTSMNNTQRRLLLSNAVELADLAAAKNIDAAYVSLEEIFAAFDLKVWDVIDAANPFTITSDAHVMLAKLYSDFMGSWHAGDDE